MDNTIQEDFKLLSSLPEGLAHLPCIDLKTLETVPLASRFDTKYLCPVKQINHFLQGLPDGFSVLETENGKWTRYKSVYLDTPDFQLYRLHHNGRPNRVKVRWRTYESDNRLFLEVKKSTPRGETKKYRLSEHGEPGPLQPRHFEFLADFFPQPHLLQASLKVHYQRCTLLHVSNGIKCTMDFGLRLQSKTGEACFPGVVILEMKHRGRTPPFEIRQLLRSLQIRQIPVSKYALGISSLEKVPYNSFLWTQLQLEKFHHELSPV
ncbi:MAG: hypothetical protein RIR17_970 [Planctomycetota bacterium]